MWFRSANRWISSLRNWDRFGRECPFEARLTGLWTTLKSKKKSAIFHSQYSTLSYDHHIRYTLCDYVWRLYMHD